jgi:hypothetical protein
LQGESWRTGPTLVLELEKLKAIQGYQLIQQYGQGAFFSSTILQRFLFPASEL